ncbi:hypothetical protein GPECTOR_4g838 [Gonium pectorale]|uniref:Macro domain-containing protein n=1 Tax=Gonium pectorale TaxID=33097 RepID=A0A150GYK7_GONPE|nr:hypothetical protein GPECTOR_4g838 [Gonium pectorale]|eukprot:KXZ54768.1 hypothetical protein GPECTOR_4g838 [Gonium pectorale]
MCFCFKKPAAQKQRLATYAAGVGAGPAMAPEKVYPLAHGAKLVLKTGDITTESVDAIVNAANERMLGGGGVDGAIHRAAGPQLVRACAEVKEVEPGVRCPTGEARITRGFQLPAKHVIHTVGPIYENDRVSAPLLASAYRSSVQLAQENGLVSMSFPGISTGVFGYPFDKAAQVAVSTVDEAVAAAGEGGSVKEVRFVIFNRPLYDEFVTAAEKLLAGKAASAAVTAAQPAVEEKKEDSAVDAKRESAAPPAVEEKKEDSAADAKGESAEQKKGVEEGTEAIDESVAEEKDEL